MTQKMPCFVSFMAVKTNLQEAQAPEVQREVWGKEDLPSLEGDQPKEHLDMLVIHKFARPDGLQL